MQMINDYLQHLEIEQKSKNTIDTYRFHLTKFHAWRETNNLNIDELKTQHFLQFKKMLLNEGKADHTVNGIISCIRGYFDYLVLQGTILNNPVATALRIRVRHKKIKPLTTQQIHDFYQYTQNLKPNLRAAFHTMMSTGARVGEVANLKKGDFRIIEDKLVITIEDAKWGSDREIPIMFSDSAKIVADYINTVDLYSEPAFRVTKRTLQTHATNFQKKTGIKFYCHIIRHTFATHLLEQGMDIEKIQFLLGHKSVSMTRHYTQEANIDVLSLAPTIWQDIKTGKGLIKK